MSTASSARTRTGVLRVPAAAVRAIRPAEWIKNGFVLAPLIFSGRVEHLATTARALAILIAFCAMASAGYLVNDLLDADLDRRHPAKRDRPIASGDLPRSTARALAALLGAAGLAGGFAVNWRAGGLVACYGGLTVAYSVALKHLVIIDVLTIVSLFVLRVLAGAVPLHIAVSHWLLVCTAMLSLFLGFTKRRQEAAGGAHDGSSSRPVLEHYSLPFLDQMVSAVTATTLLSYVIYAQRSPLIGGRMLASVPPVLYGLFRYLYLIYHRGDRRSTSSLVTRDPGIVAAVAVWVAIVAVLIYTR